MECSLAASLSVCGSGPKACIGARLNGCVGLSSAADEQFLLRCTRAHINSLSMNHFTTQSELLSRMTPKRFHENKSVFRHHLQISIGSWQLVKKHSQGLPRCRGSSCVLTLQSLFGFILKYDCGGDEAFIFHKLTLRWSEAKWLLFLQAAQLSYEVKSTSCGYLTCGLTNNCGFTSLQCQLKLHVRLINRDWLVLMQIWTCYHYKGSNHTSHQLCFKVYWQRISIN